MKFNLKLLVLPVALCMASAYAMDEAARQKAADLDLADRELAQLMLEAQKQAKRQEIGIQQQHPEANSMQQPPKDDSGTQASFGEEYNEALLGFVKAGGSFNQSAIPNRAKDDKDNTLKNALLAQLRKFDSAFMYEKYAEAVQIARNIDANKITDSVRKKDFLNKLAEAESKAGIVDTQSTAPAGSWRVKAQNIGNCLRDRAYTIGSAIAVLGLIACDLKYNRGLFCKGVTNYVLDTAMACGAWVCRKAPVASANTIVFLKQVGNGLPEMPWNTIPRLRAENTLLKATFCNRVMNWFGRGIR